MYLRRPRKHSAGETYEYWTLCAARRTAAGLRQQVVATLGKLTSEERRLWVQKVDGATLGLAGAAQLIRIDRLTQFLRQGRVVKTTHETAYLVTSLWAEEIEAQKLFELVRGYWTIEIQQHCRRDHTQREDHCQVRHAVAARNLSLMRSLAIFLFKLQRG